MVDWNRFSPSDFEYDFEKDKLRAHRITFEEAVECFFWILWFEGIKLSKTVINFLARQLEGGS